eukprot:g3243.t1
MDGMEQSPQIRAWHRAQATQQREKTWMLGVLREFERRTPLRTGNRRKPDAPSSSHPAPPSATGSRGVCPTSRTTTAAASASSPTPTTAAARGHDHHRLSESRKLVHTPPSPPSGKRSRRRRGEGAPHTSPRSAPPGFAAGNDGLLWRGAKDHDKTANTTGETATALGSSLGSSTGTSASAPIRGRASARLSPSSCGASSPVDLRSAGRGFEGGSLGLGSPPAGVILTFGEKGAGEDEDSPPRPRAFWREEWLRECGGGGGGGAGCSVPECPRNDSSTTPDERAPGDAVGLTHRVCRCRSGSSFRDGCCCCCHGGSIVKGSSCDTGLRPHRCCNNQSPPRDAQVKNGSFGGRSGNGADGRLADPSSSVARDRGLGATEAEQGRREGGENERQRHQHSGTFGTTTHNEHTVLNCGEASNGISSKVASGVGFVVLAAIAVAAFAAGTLVGPPRRQPWPTQLPSASPSDFAQSLPPHQKCEPAVGESSRAKERGPERAAGVSRIERAQPDAEEGEGRSRTNAVAGADGGNVGDVSKIEAGATAASARVGGSTMGTAGVEDQAVPDGVPVAVEPEAGCGEPLISGSLDVAPGGKTVPSTWCFNPPAVIAADEEELGRQRPSSVISGVETGSRSAPGIAALSSPPVGDVASAGSSRHEAGSSESKPSSRSTSLFSYPGVGAGAAAASPGANAGASSEGKRPLRLRAAVTETIARLSAGATPAAFAQTLGRAERRLASFSASGGDEDAERTIARRAAMSKSAARSACESLAWGRAALVAGADRGPQDDSGVCNKIDWVGENFEGVPGVDELPSTGNEGQQGGGRWRAAERTAVDAAAADTPPGSVIVGQGTAKDEDKDALLMIAEDTGHDEVCPLASYVGLGPSPSSSPSSTIATEASKTRGAAGGASRDFPSRADGVGDAQFEGSPPVSPPCRGLFLSGSDVQTSWAGRYLPAKPEGRGGDDGRQLPEVGGSSTQLVLPQPPIYYCLVSASSSADLAEGGKRVLGEEATSPPLPQLDVLASGELSAEGAAADRAEPLSTAAGGEKPSTLSTMAEITPEDEKLGPPETPPTPGTATVQTTAPPTPTLPAASTTGGASASAASAAAAAAAAAAAGNDLGLQEVADGGVLCLYWTDVKGGGRWVLDNDLKISNGVLGVTKGPVPAAADVAFPSRWRDPRSSRAGAGDGVRAAAASGHGASEVKDVLRGGGAGLVKDESACLLDAAASGGETGFEGTVDDGETGGAGGRASRVWAERRQLTWLLDSPRLQDWVEANNVFVECETM